MIKTTTTFRDHMLAYLAIHQHPVNRACHMIGIPMIVASLPLIPAVPPVGLSLFGAGWSIQFLGHYFEGKKPEFVQHPINLVLGPIAVANDWAKLLTGREIYSLEAA